MNVSGGVLDNDGVDYSVQWTGPLSWQCLHAAVLQWILLELILQSLCSGSQHKVARCCDEISLYPLKM